MPGRVGRDGGGLTPKSPAPQTLAADRFGGGKCSPPSRTEIVSADDTTGPGSYSTTAQVTVHSWPQEQPYSTSLSVPTADAIGSMSSGSPSGP